MEKLVSIMVLTYNHEDFIEDCLISIVNQTYKNIELIITDNASNDSTVIKIEQMMPDLIKRFTNVTFVKNNCNVGIVKAVNQAINRCNGEYIKDFSGDDLMFPNATKSWVQFMEENPQYGMVAGNGYIVSGDYKYEEPIGEVGGEFIYKNGLIIGTDFFRDLLERDNISAPTVLIRKNVFERYGLFDEEFPFEDWEFWLRVISNGEKIGYIECFTVMYRRSAQSVTVFDVNGKDLERKLWSYYINNMMVLDKYSNLLETKERRELYAKIFTKHFVKSLDLQCDIVLNKIWNDAKRRNIIRGAKNYLRFLAYKIGLYNFQKSMRGKT